MTCLRAAVSSRAAAAAGLLQRRRPSPFGAAAVPRTQHRPGTRLWRCTASATSSEDQPLPEQPLAADSPVLEVERQSERALAYGGIAALLGIPGLALAVAPCRAMEFLWGACPTLLVAGLGRMFGSMLLLAAVVASCLKDAAEHDRLRSETYQRLNLGLMWWGLGTVVSLWLAPQQPLRLALGVCTALLGATTAHAALTYHETSEQGLSLPYLVRQFFKSLGNLGDYKNNDSTALYSLYAYGFAAKATVAAVTAILFHGQLRLAKDGLLLAPLGTLGQALVPANGVGYALLAVVLVTLKDAAARGRLGASTFKALNIGAAIVGLTNCITLVSWQQAGVLAQSKLVSVKIVLHSGLVAVALYNYAFAKKKK